MTKNLILISWLILIFLAGCAGRPLIPPGSTGAGNVQRDVAATADRIAEKATRIKTTSQEPLVQQDATDIVADTVVLKSSAKEAGSAQTDYNRLLSENSNLRSDSFKRATLWWIGLSMVGGVAVAAGVFLLIRGSDMGVAIAVSGGSLAAFSVAMAVGLPAMAKAAGIVVVGTGIAVVVLVFAGVAWLLYKLWISRDSQLRVGEVARKVVAGKLTADALVAVARTALPGVDKGYEAEKKIEIGSV